MTLYLGDQSELERVSAGIDPRWLRPVPLWWQEELMGLDRELRLVWSVYLQRWGLLRRSTAPRTPFEDATITGWSLLTWFTPETRPAEMKEYILGMVDVAKFKDAAAANEFIEKSAQAGRDRIAKEIREKDDARIDEYFKNEDTLNREMNKEQARKLDRRHRAHDRSKSGVFVGGGA